MGPREFHEELSSTQDRAIELARAGAVAGTRVVTRRQTAGRGRLGRPWSSPAGGLYLSIVLGAPPEPVTLVPLGIGAYLARALRARYAVPVRLKWPNDLLVVDGGAGPRKLAGILVDAVPSPAFGRAVIAGIGINVRTVPVTVSREGAPPPAALEEFASDVPPLDEVEAVAVEASVAAVRRLAEPGGAGAVRALCSEWLYGVGRAVTVDGVRSGRIAALGDDGELVLESGEDHVTVRTGDVRVLEEA